MAPGVCVHGTAGAQARLPPTVLAHRQAHSLTPGDQPATPAPNAARDGVRAKSSPCCRHSQPCFQHSRSAAQLQLCSSTPRPFPAQLCRAHLLCPFHSPTAVRGPLVPVTTQPRRRMLGGQGVCSGPHGALVQRQNLNPES